MTETLALADQPSVDDLTVFLRRAARVDDGLVRLVADGAVLAVYVPVLSPAGLLDSSATVIGLRTFALRSEAHTDRVIPVASMLGAISGPETRTPEPSAGVSASSTAPPLIELPAPGSLPMKPASWAAVSPPRAGWRPAGTTTSGVLQQAARAGIAEVAEAIPSGTGEQIVHRVRSEVWGRALNSAPAVPAGAAFAGYSLGFLGDIADAEVRLFEAGRWLRVSTPRGHVLVKRRASGAAS